MIDNHLPLYLSKYSPSNILGYVLYTIDIYEIKLCHTFIVRVFVIVDLKLCTVTLLSKKFLFEHGTIPIARHLSLIYAQLLECRYRRTTALYYSTDSAIYILRYSL